MKNLFLLTTITIFALGFSACEKSYDGGYTNVTKIAGKIRDLPERDGLTLRLSVGNVSTHELPVSVPISDDGSFTLQLPSVINSALLSPSVFIPDEDGVSVSNPDVKSTEDVCLDVFDGDRMLGTVHYGNYDYRSWLFYFDGDCNVSGSLVAHAYDPGTDEIADTWNVRYDMRLKKGWNWIFRRDDRGNEPMRFSTQFPQGIYFSFGLVIE